MKSCVLIVVNEPDEDEDDDDELVALVGFIVVRKLEQSKEKMLHRSDRSRLPSIETRA